MKKALATAVAIMVGFALFAELAAAPSLFVPQEGAYLGAFVDFGFMEDYVTPEKLSNFEKLSGKKLAIVTMGSFWGKEEFPEGQVQVIKEYGAIPLIFWYPWGPPYEQNELQQRYSLKNIIDGKHDEYIRRWAKGVKASGVPVIVAFAPEMNGDWFSWSGYFNGAGESAYFGKPDRADGPERFVFAYRHVVDVVRSVNARNIIWLFHVNATPSPQADWNTLDAYYPGDSYVDWVGMSAFGKQINPGDWLSFEEISGTAYDSLAAFKKPILVVTGVGEFEDGNKAEWITQTYSVIKEEYPGIKAVIWWHDIWLNEDNSLSDLTIDSSPETLRAFRLAISDPYFLDRPIF